MRALEGGAARVAALACLFALCAGASDAQVTVNLSADQRVVEGSAGTTPVPLTATLSGTWPLPVTVSYRTLAGSASGADFLPVTTGSVTIPAGSLSAPLSTPTIQVQGDTSIEWSPTELRDEVFFVELFNPTNAVIGRGRAAVTIIDDDSAQPGVQFLTAVSGGNISIGSTKLQWRVPGAQTPVTDVHVAWKVGAGCSFPLSTTDTAGGGSIALGSAAGAGGVQTWSHTPPPAPNTTYCYSVFAVYAGTPVSGAEVANVKTRTFDSTGAVAWSYATGATSVVPPAIGPDAIYTTDNRGVVHAMARGGTGGGVWPPGWNPVSVAKPTQNRSAVVPLTGGWRLLLGTDGGGVHMVDARFGNIVWSRSTPFGSPLPSSGGTQAQPSALLKGYGGNNDMILVGTNNGGSNGFYALDPATGANLALPFTHAQMGSVFGAAVIEYPGRAFFLTNASSATVYGLDLGAVGTPALTLTALPVANPRAFNGSNGATVLRNNRLLFPGGSGQVHALNLVDGTTYSNPTGDGVVKGFVWPDRRDDRLYFATATMVHGWRDTGTSFSPLWSVPVTTPSMVLQKPGSDHVYVGDGNGNLVQIDVLNPGSPILRPLEAGAQIGAPSLDAANGIVIVGSASGTLYGVRVPF